MKTLMITLGLVTTLLTTSVFAMNESADNRAVGYINSYLIVKNLGGHSGGTPDGNGPEGVDPKVLCPAAAHALAGLTFLDFKGKSNQEIADMIELLDENNATEVVSLRKELKKVLKFCKK